MGTAEGAATVDDPATNDASIRRMATFAVMTVDWSSQRKSYLDNFLNYALAVIPADSPTAFAREAVQPSILDRFNLDLPSNIVQQLVKRATRLGFLESVGEGAIRMTDKGRREVAPIPYTLKKLAKEQVEIADKFVQWAERELGLVVNRERATAMLLDYVETYYCSLMSLSENSGAGKLNLPRSEPSPGQKVAAAFVAAIAEADAESFESIANMARGSMMVSALYAPTLVDTTRGFRHTTIYLDTKIVLRGLGYEGEAARVSTDDLIQLLLRQGARVAVFDFTLREIRAVIDAVGQKAQSGSLWVARPGSVESYFYKINASNAIIEQHSVRVESKILDLGLHVDPTPSYDNHSYVIDEDEVESDLRRGNPYYRATALKHDVELIAAVVRARSGRARDSLEESRATFITMNSLVVNTARTVQKRHRESWPLVMFEMDVATLTWVKEPLAAPNLPKQQLLATSLGLTNPSNHDWSLYISEITKLLEGSQITDNDLVLLRQRYEMDQLAFVRAPGAMKESDQRAQIRVSIDAARSEVSAELTAPIRAEVEAGSARIGQLESSVAEQRALAQSRKSESDRLLKALIQPIWRRGAILKWLTVGGLVVVAAVAIVATFVPEIDLFLSSSSFGFVLVWVLRLIAAAAAITGGFTGTIISLGRRIERKYLLSALNGRAIEPSRASEVGMNIP